MPAKCQLPDRFGINGHQFGVFAVLAEILRPVFGQRNWHHVLQFLPHKNSTIFHLSEPATAPFQHNPARKGESQDGAPRWPARPERDRTSPRLFNPGGCLHAYGEPIRGLGGFSIDGTDTVSRPRDMTWISCRITNAQRRSGKLSWRKLARCGRVPVQFRSNLGMAMDICAWTMSSGDFFAPTGRGPVRSFPFPPAGVRRSDRRKRSSGWLAFSGFLF